MMKRSGWMLVLVLSLSLSLSLSANRANADMVWGPQAGFSLEPTQVVFGFHVIAPLSRSVDFVPSIDLGVGDEAFTIAGNGDIHFNFSPESSMAPYVGGGITVYNWNPNDSAFDGGTEVGGSVLGGLWLNRTGSTSYYLEAKLGLGDVPDFKALIGLNL